MTTITYLVGAHHNLDHLQRLIGTLLDGDDTSRVLLHFDHARTRLDLGSLCGHPRIELVEDWRPIRLFTASHLDALLASFRQARRSGRDDWLVVLSGQDYPIRPLSELHDFLDRSPSHAHIMAKPVARPVWGRALNDPQSRYFGRWRIIDEEARRANPLLRAGTKLAGRLRGRTRGRVAVRPMPGGGAVAVRTPTLRDPFNGNTVCHWGWDYFGLSSAGVDEVLRVERTQPKLLAHYRHTFNPSESFFATVLASSALAVEPTPLHWITFDPNAPHPSIVQMDDFDALSSSGRFFARKFDHASGSILDRIDRELLGVEEPKPRA